MTTSHNPETDGPREAGRDPAKTLAQPAGVSLGGTAFTTIVGQETVAAAQCSLTDGVRVRYFGDYEIHHELGRGGMGVVYEARQISLNRPVALKMIRAGLLAGDAELRRFRNEAEAVAAMDHVGIVPVHEVGEHDGQRYLSMKLVPGGSLADRLEDYRDDPQGAARLVAEAAEAVHHAHRRGILHRDLKPANILIDEHSRPHITDFGLARRVAGDSELTETGAILGTPSYMSPEQASGHRAAVTTASDIYGLGAVLYALLAGKAPFAGESVLETLDAVRTRAPEPPSRLNAQMPRDLEVICLKCLEKEPARRYATAGDLAEDLRRYLAGEPIAARPTGRALRLWMWARRNPALASMAAALALALLGGLAATTWKWREAERRKGELAAANRLIGRERDQAEREAAKARAVERFLIDDILDQAAPEKNPRSRGVTIEDALDLAGRSIGERFASQPEVEVPVRAMVGRTYRKLGNLDKAEPHLRRALDLGRHSLGEWDLQTLQVADDLATLLQDQGKLAEAEPLFRATLAGQRRVHGPDHSDTLSAANNLAVLMMMRGKVDEAEPLFREALAGQEAKLGRDDPQTLMTMGNLASVLAERGKLAEAEALQRAVLEARTRVQGPEHPNTLLAGNALARLLHLRDRLSEAEPMFRRLLETRRRVNGPEHPDTLIAVNNLALVLRSRGELDEAEALIRDCLDIRRRVLGPDHAHTLAAMNILASILQDRGRFAEAEPLFRTVFEAIRRTLGDEHADTHTVANNLALVLHLMGRLDEAASLYRGSLAFKESRLGPEHPDTLLTINNLAALLYERGEPAAAEPLARRAMETDRRVMGPDHWQTVRATGTLAAICLARGRPAEAERLARDALAVSSTDSRVRRGASALRSVVGGALAALGRAAEAEPLLIAGYQGQRADRGASPRHVRDALERLIAFYDSRGQHTQAESWRLLCLDSDFPTNPFAR
jgi:tetratricopeptide (TPR) repeat protein